MQWAYEDLERAVDKALSEDKYAVVGDQIKNLVVQQRELSYQAQKERDKKKTDKDKVADLERQVVELNQEISDLLDNIKEDIIGGTSQSIAQELGNAFLDAFSKGEDAAEAWGNKVNDIVGDIVRNLVIQKFLEAPIQDAIDNLYAKIMPGAVEAEKVKNLIDSAKKQIEEIDAGATWYNKGEIKKQKQALEEAIVKWEEQLENIDLGRPLLDGEAFKDFENSQY